MDREQKQTFILNVVKFLIWAVLLLFSYQYIQQNPAEKVSLLSWFQVIYQKGEVIYYRVTGKNVDAIKQKHNLEQYFQELIRVTDERPCVDPTVVSSLHEDYATLRSLHSSDLSQHLWDLSAAVIEYDEVIQSPCE